MLVSKTGDTQVVLRYETSNASFSFLSLRWFLVANYRLIVCITKIDPKPYFKLTRRTKYNFESGHVHHVLHAALEVADGNSSANSISDYFFAGGPLAWKGFTV